MASTNASASASSSDGRCRAEIAGHLLGAVITTADCAHRGRVVGAEVGLVMDASLGRRAGSAALARAAATLFVSEATLPREGLAAEGADEGVASIINARDV